MIKFKKIRSTAIPKSKKAIGRRSEYDDVMQNALRLQIGEALEIESINDVALITMSSTLSLRVKSAGLRKSLRVITREKGTRLFVDRIA